MIFLFADDTILSHFKLKRHADKHEDKLGVGEKFKMVCTS